MRRAVLAALALVAAASSVVAPGAGATATKGIANPNPTAEDTPIVSSGPLTNIELGDELSCQVAYQFLSALSPQNQVYHPSITPADCGTFLAVGRKDKQLFAPHFASHAFTATWALGAYTPYTKVSQTTQTGSGTLADPYIVTTVVDAGFTGLRITQIDTYVTGQRHFRSDIVVTNNSAVTQTAILYRGADCYLTGSDSGKGIVLPNPAAQTTGVGCVASNTSARSQRLIPLTAGNTYMEGSYSAVWAAIGAKAPLPNTCQCASVIDNGIAVGWNISLPPNGSVIRTVLHQFTDLKVVDVATAEPVRCTIDPGAIPTADPRPDVSCDVSIAEAGAASCGVAAAGSGSGADGAAGCATGAAGAACRVRARTDGEPAVPCEVWQGAGRALPSPTVPRGR